MNIERFKAIQRARKGQSRKSSRVIHSVPELGLKKGAALLETIGQEFADRPLITKEMEVLDFSVSAVDFNIFLAPPGFDQVDFEELFVQQDIRAQ